MALCFPGQYHVTYVQPVESELDKASEADPGCGTCIACDMCGNPLGNGKRTRFC